MERHYSNTHSVRVCTMIVPLIPPVILVLSSFILSTEQGNPLCFSGDDEVEAAEISHAFLQNCEDSKVVDVSNRRIRNIQNGTFQGLTQLKRLYLNDNILELLNSGTFCGASNLTEIDLKGNRLYGMRAGTFECVPKLEVLLLDRNNIEYFSVDSFVNLMKLKILKLSFNKLTDRSIPLELFKELISLTSLDLSNNFLTVISKTFFQGLNNLEKLYLSWNRLISVNMVNWSNNLKTVKIGNNLQLDWITVRPEQLQLKDLNDFSTLYYQCNCTSNSSLYFTLVKNKEQLPSCEAQCKTSLTANEYFTANEYSSQKTQDCECSASISYNGCSCSRIFYTVVITFVSYIMISDYCNG